MEQSANDMRPKVLVIDDESLVRRVFARMIRCADVITVGTAEEALERLESDTIDVILCDLSLPGLPAPDFYARLEADGSGLHKRFAVVTGGATSVEHEKFLANSGVPVVMKPTTPAVLDSLVQSLLPTAA